MEACRTTCPTNNHIVQVMLLATSVPPLLPVCLLLLTRLAAPLLLAAAHADPVAWATAAAEHSGSPLPAIAAPAPGPRATMRCLGVVYWARTCLFHNLVYDAETKRFLYFGHPSDTPAAHSADPSFKGEPWLRMTLCASSLLLSDRKTPARTSTSEVICTPRWCVRRANSERMQRGEAVPHTGSPALTTQGCDHKPPIHTSSEVFEHGRNRCSACREEGQCHTQDCLFFMDWHTTAPYPPASQTFDMKQPVHLRQTFNEKSFGHMLRDTFSYLAYLPARLGEDPEEFLWLRCAQRRFPVAWVHSACRCRYILPSSQARLRLSSHL